MNEDARDLLAGFAMIGLLMRYGHEGFSAEEAYEIADEMIEHKAAAEEGIAKLAKKTRRKNGSDA